MSHDCYHLGAIVNAENCFKYLLIFENNSGYNNRQMHNAVHIRLILFVDMRNNCVFIGQETKTFYCTLF